MTTAERYQSVSAQLLEQAHLELEADDLIQASEKFWGATAQSLKAIAHERAWEHKSHANFYRIIRDLVTETDDKELVFLFQAADTLHANFYEHWLEIDEIEKLADQVRELLARLDDIQTSTLHLPDFNPMSPSQSTRGREQAKPRKPIQEAGDIRVGTVEAKPDQSATGV